MYLSVIGMKYNFYHSFQLLSIGLPVGQQDARVTLDASSNWRELVVGGEGTPDPTETRKDCHYYNCFNVYRCGRSGNQHMSV